MYGAMLFVQSNYAVLYGVGASKLAAENNISNQEATFFMNNFKQTMVCLTAFMQSSRIQAVCKVRQNQDAVSIVKILNLCPLSKA